MSALIIPLAISPQYECARANIRAGLDEAVSSEPVQIKLQSSSKQTRSRARAISNVLRFLQRGSIAALPWSRCITPRVSASRAH
jgi:hypothetical protein